jgi:SOS response regulatory protein OraA/RecX
MDEVYHRALKLLSMRDYTVAELRSKLEAKFGPIDERVLNELRARKFLDDRRIVLNFLARKPRHSLEFIRERLLERGVDAAILAESLENIDKPSLRDVVNATMSDWNLREPLHRRDIARLFRALNRLGYQEDAIREELERFHEQQ